MTWATLSTEGVMRFHPGIPRLPDLQVAVGGYVEAVSFPVAGSEATMWLNEEGKLVAEPQRNWKADVVCPLAWGDWTAGDVVFSGGVGPQGETLALTPAQVQELRRVDRDVHVILLGDEQSIALIG